MPKLEQSLGDALTLTPEQYIKANYEPSDRLALVVLNRRHAETIQRIATAEVIADRFQGWLRYKNAQGSDIYISQNALNDHADGRTKSDVKTIRHVYLDLDRNGDQALAKIEANSAVPKPNFVINTSPGKYQVIWKVEGMNQAESENLMRAMVREFGGDPAATDSTRVLRLPGFFNKKKYEGGHRIEAQQLSSETYRPQDFKISLEATQTSTEPSAQSSKAERSPTHQRTPSEHDWAWVMRKLERGEPLNKLIQKVADYRDDKPNPEYYARLTVTRAYAFFKISRGENPQEVVRAISAYPPHSSENGLEYAKGTVQRAIEQVAQSHQHQKPEVASQGQASQKLGLRITP